MADEQWTHVVESIESTDEIEEVNELYRSLFGIQIHGDFKSEDVATYLYTKLKAISTPELGIFCANMISIAQKIWKAYLRLSGIPITKANENFSVTNNKLSVDTYSLRVLQLLEKFKQAEWDIIREHGNRFKHEEYTPKKRTIKERDISPSQSIMGNGFTIQVQCSIGTTNFIVGENTHIWNPIFRCALLLLEFYKMVYN